MTVNGKDYQVLRLLGKGKGGYSYLVTDGDRQLVLKQIHHEPCDYYQFGDKLASELADYDRLRAIGIPMPELLEVDRENERILKAYIDGPMILDRVLGDAMEGSYFEQIHAMCDVLYANGLNIDYFPTNFIVENGNLYYIDYECNGYMEQWDFEHWGCTYWEKSPQLLQYAREHGFLR
jgi:hypothetical protein